MDLGVDDELGLPKATIAKMIAEALSASMGSGASLRMSPECRDMVVECCQEFIHAVSAEANEVSTKELKSTITAEHVLAALRRLGFDAYEAECEIARDEAKEEETEKRELKKKRKTTQMSEEDAIAMQQELFARAAARIHTAAFSLSIRLTAQQLYPGTLACSEPWCLPAGVSAISKPLFSSTGRCPKICG